MNDIREATKQNREHSITSDTAALLAIAERRGWYVERYYNHRGEDTLKIARNDILCGPDERDVGSPRCPYSVTIPVADQGELPDIIYDHAHHFDINGFLNCTFPKRSIHDDDEPYDFEGMERDSELLRAAMKNFCGVLY